MRPASLPVFSILLATLACGRGGTGGDAAREPAFFDAPAPAYSQTPPPRLAIPESAPTVVFLGDSIGAGLHLAEHQAFPAVLQARLAEAGAPFHLVNASESGRTSASGVQALDWVLRREPQVVVIELGGNDGLRGIPLSVVEANLRAMIERAQAAGAAVLLLGVRLPPNYGELAAAFDALYPALAQEYGVAFVPSFMEGVGAVPEMNLPDGLHPTPEGHAQLAENVAPALREVLDELSRAGQRR